MFPSEFTECGSLITTDCVGGNDGIETKRDFPGEEKISRNFDCLQGADEIVEDGDQKSHAAGEDIKRQPPSLLKATMTTAAIINDPEAAEALFPNGTETNGQILYPTAHNSNNSMTSTTSTSESPANGTEPGQRVLTTVMDGMSTNFQRISIGTSRATSAIGNLLPTATITQLTTRKYTLPDKTTASQVLMYRQLLHTACRPGLRLSRKFQGTTAQRAVMHMPWWEEGVEETGKMVISYDNLITRLWLNGAVLPFEALNLLGKEDEETPSLDNRGLPPIPHQFWVDRLGFQQDDPVTDFRSGGVLSLALLVHIVEACPHVHKRFLTGEAKVLPYALTSINITDMLAKILMFSKSVDRIDALLSSKPFWRMFSDPNALLVLHELCVDMLCDVVGEMARESEEPITVFHFTQIMETTEKRVREDLLGSGPKTVEEMRSIGGRLRIKYQRALERRQKQKQSRLARAESLERKKDEVVGAVTGSMGNMGNLLRGLKGGNEDSPAMGGTIPDLLSGDDDMNNVKTNDADIF
mmetsp:Transcript_53156/g.64038  ORF Transcript_53156/g.64038 Transcript_53156/m.64038 type:complete len:526 (+) Transcript_53156:286-1863(+)